MEGFFPVYYANSDYTIVLRATCIGGETYRKSDASGYRLPTEAEWEYAAGMSGDEEGSLRHIYAGTDDTASLPEYAWNVKSCDLVGRKGTWNVGILKPTEKGCYDFSGNVAEWCDDWYDKNWYLQGSNFNPTGPLSSPDLSKVTRGSSWLGANIRCTVAYRESKKFNGKGHTIGFRLARNY